MATRHETRDTRCETLDGQSSASLRHASSVTATTVLNEQAAVGAVVKERMQTLLGSRFSLLSVLFLIALLLRLYQLDGQSLWLDELNTWWLIKNASWSALWGDLWRSESAYPLYHLLLKGWMSIAGDSAWALRFPSALAGAGAVVAVYLAGEELSPTKEGRNTKADHLMPSSFVFRLSSRAAIAALLLAFSPFALWYAQEVKTYSFLLCSSALTIWLFLQGLRRNNRRSWLAFAAVAFVSVFIHRFALLLLLGCAAAWVAVQTGDRRQETGDRRQEIGSFHVSRFTFLVSCLLSLASVYLIWQMTQGLGDEGATTGEHIAAGPLQAGWITLWRFLLDRGPWETPWLWLVPGVLLAVWGAWQLLRDLVDGDRVARALLFCGIVPLALFFIQLWWTRLFEPRYLMIVYPIWVLILSYPFGRTKDEGRRTKASITQTFVFRLSSFICLLLVLGAGLAALFQPVKGLWSGDPVKEQYREAIRYLVDRAHPDDVVVLHPEYLRTAWDYYAPRFTTGPLPTPVMFDAFKKRQQYFSQRDWDASRERVLSNHFRSLLLIAPAHARTVDPINPAYPDDEYGLVGLYYQHSWEQNKWPCGEARFNGVHVLCQASPEAYVTGRVAQPQTSLEVQFGNHIQLQGYTLPDTPVRAGSVLPITLYWDTTEQPTEDYFVFLHLCQDCNVPPVASDDGPPLGGGVPTSLWKPGHPVHDERTVVLPPNLPPGRYTLLLGLYRPGDATLSARLPVHGGNQFNENRVMIGTVEVIAP